MRKKRYRINPLGYVVLSIIILVMLVGIYFIIWSMGKSGGNADPSSTDALAPTPTPSLAPLDSVPTPTPSLAPVDPVTSAPVVPDTPTAPPTTPPAPTPDPNSKAVRTPTPKEVEGAYDGTLRTGGVVLRAGPSQDYAILGKYSSGTRLKIYATDGDYYYVQIVKEGVYGYMAKQFVNLATPSPTPPEGAIMGTVTASIVALRTAPDKEDDSNKIGQIKEGDKVVIYFKTGDFYYIDANGVKCYAYAQFITPDSVVPAGTPVP